MKNSKLKIGARTFSAHVPSICDASFLAFNGPCKLFPYYNQRNLGVAGVFILAADGRVYSGRRVDIAGEFGCNDNERRAWCKASGVKFSELRAVIKAHRQKQAQLDRSQRVERLRSGAARLGYKLVKAAP